MHHPHIYKAKALHAFALAVANVAMFFLASFFWPFSFF